MLENRKKTIWIISIILVLLIPTTGVLAREFAAGSNAIALSPVSSDCAGFDYALKFEGSDLVDPKTKTGDGNSITISNFTYKASGGSGTEILTFDWTATVGISQVVVKAGNNGGYTQTYNDALSGSEATLNNKGLSHVTFCWNEPEDEESEVRVSVGACTWTAAGGSTRAVSLTITGASVTITKTGGSTYGPYTSSQTISLPAGAYTYSYTATAGYTGSGSGSFTVDECPAASASVAPQSCVWDPTEETSSTDVILTISNATLTITGPNAYQQSFTNSQTVNLPPGSYSYSWTANSGYSGSGSGTFTLDECEPKVGSADVTIGGCEWNPIQPSTSTAISSGSMITVIITLDNSSLTIAGQTYTESTEIKLAPGTYAYTWVGTAGATGSGSGSITLYGCEPASVTVNVDVCEWVNEVSMNDVILSISGATLTIYQDSVAVGTYTSSQTISLPAGDYTYSWTANTNYTGSGSGSFTLIECEPGKGDATVNVGACEWDATNGSQINVTITLENAELTIDGETYTESTEIKLSPGTYAYSWVATGDNEGSGTGEITIYGCEPASVTVDLGGCEWDGAKSVTDVTLTISGATLTIFQDSVAVDTYTTSQVISLPEGEYTYTWEALENYTGSGSGTITLVNCEPGVASASISLGVCGFETNTSLTQVILTLNFATLSINGETYTESTVIQLEPGEYDYSWEASDEEHVGQGSGTLVVGDCSPKDEDTPDPVPDVAAGGQGPSLVSIFTPIFAAIAGLFVAWSMLKNKVMRNR